MEDKKDQKPSSQERPSDAKPSSLKTKTKVRAGGGGAHDTHELE